MVNSGKLIAIVWFLTISSVFATTFAPVPFGRQLRESDGVVHVRFNSASYKKLPNGEIVTMGSFQIIKSIGVPNSDIVNKNNFVVTYPGGHWQNKGYQVHGSPEFKVNEEAVLILKKADLGYRIKGLSLGKYNFSRENDTKNLYISSSVFPNHPKLGKIMMSDFEYLVEDHYGEKFVEINSDKYVHFRKKKIRKANQRRGRMPASVDEDIQAAAEHNKLHVNWLVLLLGALGVVSLHLARRSKKK